MWARLTRTVVFVGMPLSVDFNAQDGVFGSFLNFGVPFNGLYNKGYSILRPIDHFRGLYNKDYDISQSILGSPYLDKNYHLAFFEFRATGLPS